MCGNGIFESLSFGNLPGFNVKVQGEIFFHKSVRVLDH